VAFFARCHTFVAASGKVYAAKAREVWRLIRQKRAIERKRDANGTAVASFLPANPPDGPPKTSVSTVKQTSSAFDSPPPISYTPVERVISPTSISVGCNNKIVWIKVTGKGSFQNSSGMKDFAREMMNRGLREFVVDLENCPVMDSTFMGTLAGISLRLRELGTGNLHAINLNTRNKDLLQNLGLDQLFEIETKGLEEKFDPSRVRELSPNTGQVSKTGTAETMLEAHEALVEAAPENETRFKDVLEYLKNDLHQEATSDI
jgi:anti-sigma B factor antagonist